MHSLTKLLFHDLLWSLQILLKNILGTFAHPYLTWKHITRDQYYLPSLLVITIAIAAFNIRAPIKEGLPDSAPTAITTLISNLSISIIGFLLIAYLIYSLCRYFNSRVNFLTIASVWAYSYIPTLIWFLITQGAYVLLPPPRTTSLAGILFTLLYISFSVSLLAWKLLLLWLTFQIPGRLLPTQAFIATTVTAIFVTFYWYVFYTLGLWGIPFL